MQKQVKQGKGSKLFKSGNFYNGEWFDDQMHGVGGLYYSNENYFYKGGFNMGELTGRGIFYYSDKQDFYLGEVLNGKYHGKGLYYNNAENQWDLNEYEHGEITKNIKQGEGKPQYLHISKEIAEDSIFEEIYIKPKDFIFDHYEGDILNGKKHGNGILFSKDGSRQEGSWSNNKPNGIGVFVYQDQKFDIGTYSNGYLEGLGRSQYYNGDLYKGNFHKGRMQGLGLYLYKGNREWVFGYFKNNNIAFEFEKGKIMSLNETLNNYKTLEKKYQKSLQQIDYSSDIQDLDNYIFQSESKRRTQFGHESSKSGSPGQQSKKKVLNILFEEQVTKRQAEQPSSYCHLF